MHKLPHLYQASASGEDAGNILLQSNRLPDIDTAPPEEFGGPGDLWSPETLLVAAVADCFVLTFRAIARASKLTWHSMTCNVTGTLAKPQTKIQFTHFTIKANLILPDAGNESQAQRILEKSEHSCLITNSLSAKTDLIIAIEYHK